MTSFGNNISLNCLVSHDTLFRKGFCEQFNWSCYNPKRTSDLHMHCMTKNTNGIIDGIFIERMHSTDDRNNGHVLKKKGEFRSTGVLTFK